MNKFLSIIENIIVDADSFLQISHGEWFNNKKEKLAMNYSVLPKCSLVSKDVVKAKLGRLEKGVNANYGQD